MISNEDTQRLSILLSNYITFENNSNDNSYLTIYSNYSSNKGEIFFTSIEDIFDNEIDKSPDNNTWRIDYFSFVENEINKLDYNYF